VEIVTEKVAAAAGYCIATTMCTAGFFDWIKHLDWNFIMTIGGFVIGLITMLIQAYFDLRRTRAYEKAINAGIVTQAPKKRTLFNRGGE